MLCLLENSTDRTDFQAKSKGKCFICGYKTKFCKILFWIATDCKCISVTTTLLTPP